MVLRLSVPRLKWSPSLRLAAFGFTLGISVLGLSFAYFRRRRRSRSPPPVNRTDLFAAAGLPESNRFGGGSSSVRGHGSSRKTGSISSRASTLRGSVRSHGGVSSTMGAAGATNEEDVEESEMSAETCGLLGVQALRLVIDKLEDALYDFKRFEDQLTGVTSGDSRGAHLVTDDSVSHCSSHSGSQHGNQTLALMHDLKNLLQEAYSVKERWKQNVIMQTDVCDVISDLSRDEDDKSSDDDSFVSASEYIDLSDLDVLISETSKHERYLYRIALVELEQGNVTCRTIRTQMVGCETDSEYLAKVHCLRMAFDHILADSHRQQWIRETSKTIITELLQQLGGATDRFGNSFDNMMEFLTLSAARSVMSEELGPRGVKRINFYDIVLDLMFLDSFEQLAKPPSSLLSVINNRWLSNGFKRTALESAVWTLLLAKRKLLKRSDGFVAHFYAIIGDVSPALAWGFLGPDEEMRDTCQDFMDKLLLAVRNMFSFTYVRYTTVAELADDVFALQKQLVRNLSPGNLAGETSTGNFEKDGQLNAM